MFFKAVEVLGATVRNVEILNRVDIEKTFQRKLRQ